MKDIIQDLRACLDLPARHSAHQTFAAIRAALRVLEDDIAYRPTWNAIGDIIGAKPTENVPDLLKRLASRPSYYPQLRAIFDALPPEPRCRDCADEDGRCPTQDHPCDPTEYAIELIGLGIAARKAAKAAS